MSSTSAYTLLLDLDCLFDTRMGTLLDLDPDLTQHLDPKAYRERERDDFTQVTQGRVTTEAFQARYATRDITVLQKSLVSGIVPVLLTYVDGLKERLFRKVDVSSIRIDLNLYPYTLPGPILETITGCLRVLLPTWVEVGVGSYKAERLTPEFFDKYYNGWITYDLHTWLTVHNEALLVKPLTQLSAIVPRLFLREPGDYEDSEDESLKGADRHGLFEMVMEDFLHLEHIPVEDFCYLMPGAYRLPEDQASSPPSAS